MSRSWRRTTKSRPERDACELRLISLDMPSRQLTLDLPPLRKGSCQESRGESQGGNGPAVGISGQRTIRKRWTGLA